MNEVASASGGQAGSPVLRSVLVLALAACGGGGDGGGTGPGLVVSKSQGDNQSGTVGTLLPAPFCVLVTEGGTPKAAVAVSWSTTAPGATLPGSTPTGSDGMACSRMTAGTVAGQQTSRAVVNGAGGSPLTFMAFVNPGPAAAIAVLRGDGQAAKTDSGLAKALEVEVRDQFGNLVSSTTVSWVITGGAGQLGSPSTTTTGGVADNTLRVGSVPGAIQVLASIGAQNQVTFTAHAVTLVRDVLVKNNFFESVANGSAPVARDTVPSGEAVRWTWAPGAVAHNVLPEGSPSFPGVSGSNNAPFSHGPIFFGAAGTYTYVCNIHPGMTGTVVVTP